MADPEPATTTMQSRPPVQLPDLTDDFPLDALLARREQERLDAEWEAAGGVNVDLSQGGLDQAEQGGKQMGQGQRISPPQESASEQVRDKVSKAAGPFRQKLDKVVKTMTGSSLDDITKAVQEGTLDQQIRLKLLDPAGNISEELLRQASKDSGLDDSTSEQIGKYGGVALGILFPPGGISGARKGVKEGAEIIGAAGVKAGEQALKGPGASRLAGTAPDVVSVIKNISAYNAARMEAGVVTHAETIAKAERLMPMADALALDVTKYDLATLQTAVARHYKDAASYYTDIAKRAAAGDASAATEYWGAFAVVSDLAAKDALLGTQVGRGLEARKIALEELKGVADPRALQQMAETMAGGVDAGMDAAVHAQRMLTLNAAQRATVLKQTATAMRAGQNALLEAWINGLLSGPQTHVANMTSNALMAGWAPVERFLAAGLDAGALTGNRSVYFGESVQMLYGMVEGLKDGIRLAGRALREGAPIGPEKIERVPAITAEAFGMKPDTLWGGATDLLGAIIRTPSRLLITEDAAFKAINYRGELRALAYREAANEGLAGSAFWARVKEIIADPPPAVKDAADQFKLTQTLNREFGEMGTLGAIGGAVSSGVEKVPILRTILPFIRTPTNSLHFASERVPILNMLSDTLRADIAAGGAQRAQALAKITGGMGISAVVATYAVAPIDPDSPTPYMTLVTGEGPKDARMRAQLMALGWQPYSVWNPATKGYVSYKRTEPLGTILGIVSSYTEIAGQVDELGASELASAIGIATSKAMLSKTFLTGLSDFLDSMEGNPQDINRFFNGLARSGVPALVRQTTRALDPVKKDVDTLFDHWRSGLPGYDGPPDHNVWGDEIMYSGGLGPDIISPYYTTQPIAGQLDPVTHWMVQNRVVISNNLKVVGGGAAGETPYLRTEAERPVKLTKEERQRLKVLIGKGGQAPSLGLDLGPLDGAPTLKDAVGEIIRGAGTNGPGGSKASIIQSLVNQRKQMAIQQLRRESPELDTELSRREQDSLRQKTEEPAPTPQGRGPLDAILKLIPGR